jgi:hypothetical protein
MELKPVNEWHEGWSLESKKELMKTLKIPMTVKEGLKMVFKGWIETRLPKWNRKISFPYVDSQYWKIEEGK